jgi:hypothetical protein
VEITFSIVWQVVTDDDPSREAPERSDFDLDGATMWKMLQIVLSG